MKTVLTVVIGVLISFSLIYFARPISEWLVNSFSRGPRLEPDRIAEIVNFEGSSYARTAESGKFVPIRENLKLSRKDELKTERSGRIHLKMPSGYEIELQPESQMILDLWSAKSGPEYFSLTRGSFRVLREGKKGALYILVDRKAYLPEEAPPPGEKPMPIYVLTPSTIDETAKSPESVISKPTPTSTNRIGAQMPEKKTADGETLSSAYIENILSNQAPLFRRCQLTSLRDGTPSTGNMTMAFGISHEGKTLGVHIVSSNVKNKDLENCSVSVVERTKFKAYSGTEVQLSYPIEFR